MVRFARAEGSKGSNKRVLEEATPWCEMVGQMKKRKTDDDMMKSDRTAVKVGENILKKIKKKTADVDSEIEKNSIKAVKDTGIRGLEKKKKKRKKQNDEKYEKFSETTNIPKGVADEKNEDEKLETALFNGVWVTKEGAERLEKLRADLRNKGVSKEELRMVLRKEQRKEEKFLRRERKRVCLRCRKRGHLVRDCPEIDIEYGGGQDICYICGSTEHRVSQCSQRDKGIGYPHASCYICKRKGHIARQCPDNPRGLYPNGGACRGCGSVDHLAANCPDLQAEREAAEMKVSRIDGMAVESLDVNEQETAKKKKTFRLKKNKAKVINF